MCYICSFSYHVLSVIIISHQKQEIVLQKLAKAYRTVRITDYTIMLSAYGVDNIFFGIK